MIYGSVCSGIEAATAAWHPLGWKPAFFSEIEKFPSAVLKHHYPDVPNHGNMEKHNEWPRTDIDVLVGGTPCQSFSVAGLREGMADPRGNLALTYLAILDRLRPRWSVWENVPGVLSSNKGRDLGSFLGGLAELGYGWAYRICDAQYYGVPQRRRRIFVVGYLGDWRPPAAVLFEQESLLRHPPPSREAGQGVAPGVATGPPFSRTSNERVEAEAYVLDRAAYNQEENAQFDPEISPMEKGCPALTQHSTTHAIANSVGANSGRQQIEQTYVPEVPDPVLSPERKGIGHNREDNLVTHPLTARHDSSEDGGGRGTPLVPVAFNPDQSEKARSMGESEEQSPTLRSDGPVAVSIGFQGNNSFEDPVIDGCPPMKSESGAIPAVAQPKSVMENVRGELRVSDVADSVKCGGGKPGQGYQAAMVPVAFDPGQSDKQKATEQASVDHTPPLISARPHAVAFEPRIGRTDRGAPSEVCPPLKTSPDSDAAPAVAFTMSSQSTGFCWEKPYYPTLDSHPQSDTSNRQVGIRQDMAVRRLTPVECERLQGFEDGYTRIEWRGKSKDECPDGPRYKALGNSMAVPVMRWIGERIQLVDDLIDGLP